MAHWLFSMKKKLVKEVKLSGTAPLVRFNNGKIITVAKEGKLIILSENLEILQTFNRQDNCSDSFILWLTCNGKYIAFGDDQGRVHYYGRNHNSASEVRV